MITMKISLIKTSIIFVLLLTASSECLAVATYAEIVNQIKIRDSLLKSDNFRQTSFEISTPEFYQDPYQGLVFQNCKATWNKDKIAMNITYSYEKEPVYVSPEAKIYQRNDYDQNKRLIKWRFTESYILTTPDRNEKLDKMKCFFVDPNTGKSQLASVSIIKHIFPVTGGYDAAFNFKQFLLATGLGYSDFLSFDDANSIQSQPPELIKICSKGFYGKELHGLWKLTINSDPNFYIKEASFTPDGANKPSISVQADAFVKKGNIAYSQVAHLKISPITADICVNEISLDDSNSCYNSILGKLNEQLPAGSEIVDFRGGTPKRYTIKNIVP